MVTDWWRKAQDPCAQGSCSFQHASKDDLLEGTYGDDGVKLPGSLYHAGRAAALTSAH